MSGYFGISFCPHCKKPVAMCVVFLCAAVAALGVSIFLNVRKIRQSNKRHAPAAVRAAYSKEQVARLIEKMKEMTAAPAVRITAAESAKPLPMSASKFGGLPYWEAGEAFPFTEGGEPLYLLAQINFAEVPLLPDYPTEGLLQIFIAADGDFGASEDENQENWRVIWRERFDEAHALDEAALRALGIQSAQEAEDEDGQPLRFPLKKEYALSFTKVQSHVNPTNYAIDDAFPAAARELGLPELKDGDLNDVFDEDDYRLLYGDLSLTHQIGGYPYSTQEETMRDGDLLLFQMASDDGIDWLDGGLAHFYIRCEDLKNRDFSRVAYSWDNYGLYGE